MMFATLCWFLACSESNRIESNRFLVESPITSGQTVVRVYRRSMRGGRPKVDRAMGVSIVTLAAGSADDWAERSTLSTFLSVANLWDTSPILAAMLSCGKALKIPSNASVSAALHRHINPRLY